MFRKNSNCVLSFYPDFISMCLKPNIETFTCEMSVGEAKMDPENVVLKPQKRKKLRRLKKRKYFTPLGFDLMQENGRPMKQRRTKTAAPQNTTQFIMEDKEVTEPFYVISSPSTSPVSHCTSSPGSVRGSPLSDRDLAFDSTEEDLVRDFEDLDFDLDFFQKDFEATYNRIQEESLLELSKIELVNKFRELEGKGEILQKRCEEIGRVGTHGQQKSSTAKYSYVVSPNAFPAPAEKSQDESTLLCYLEELRRENKSLVEENLRLKSAKCSLGLSRLS